MFSDPDNKLTPTKADLCYEPLEHESLCIKHGLKCFLEGSRPNVHSVIYGSVCRTFTTPKKKQKLMSLSWEPANSHPT